MVDLAIASNFARELTEEQFGQSRRQPGTRAGSGSRSQPAARAAKSAHSERSLARADGAARRSSSAPAGSKGFAATTLGRLLSRRVQVRG